MCVGGLGAGVGFGCLGGAWFGGWVGVGLGWVVRAWLLIRCPGSADRAVVCQCFFASTYQSIHPWVPRIGSGGEVQFHACGRKKWLVSGRVGFGRIFWVTSLRLWMGLKNATKTTHSTTEICDLGSLLEGLLGAQKRHLEITDSRCELRQNVL